MKIFISFCMAVLMAMVLVACGGNGAESTLNTSSAKAFAKSFDVMYEDLADEGRADLLYYFPVVLYKGEMANHFLKSLGMAGRPSAEMLLSKSARTIAAYKKGCNTLFEYQAKSGQKVTGHNLKELNGATAAEIIGNGKTALEAFRRG